MKDKMLRISRREDSSIDTSYYSNVELYSAVTGARLVSG